MNVATSFSMAFNFPFATQITLVSISFFILFFSMCQKIEMDKKKWTIFFLLKTIYLYCFNYYCVLFLVIVILILPIILITSFYLPPLYGFLFNLKKKWRERNLNDVHTFHSFPPSINLISFLFVFFFFCLFNILFLFLFASFLCFLTARKNKLKESFRLKESDEIWFFIMNLDMGIIVQ